jgi:anaerobic dimethyl sulfoxide reductase subunit A
MASVVMVEECALANVDPETDLDDAGCFNVLAGPIMSDRGIQAWNSTNVQVEKWSGDFVDDHLRPQRIVEG